MNSESMHEKLGRNRPPRVHITFDMHTGNAIEKKELPFVVGVLGDFSGTRDNENPLPRLKERKFIDIDQENFNDVLKGLKPRLAYSVDNKLPEGYGSVINVNLQFRNM